MIHIVPYQTKYDKDIRKLCQIPVSGNISLALEREPCYLIGARIQCETEAIYLALDNEKQNVWAVFNIGKRRLWHQKKVTDVRYLCDLRIHPEKQNSSLLFSIIKKFKSLTQNDKLPAQTVVFADNHQMNNFIERRSKSESVGHIPYYHLMGTLHTYLLPVQSLKKIASHLHIRKADKSDIPAMQHLLDQEGSSINYFPYYDFSNMEADYYYGLSLEDFFLLFKGSELMGMVAIWDQSACKQTRIIGYSTTFKILRPAYNLWTRLSSQPTLPPPGGVLKYAYLFCFLVKNRNPEYGRLLLSHIQNQKLNDMYDYILCTFDCKDPLHQVPQKLGYIRKIKGYYFLVNMGQELPKDVKQPFHYLEGARI